MLVISINITVTMQKNKEQRTANSTYKKLAVQWLNEALCFVSIPIAIGSGGRQFSSPIRRGGRQLLLAANRQTV